jgi:hypothetical protein
VIPLEFKSHTSRLSAYPRNAYWHMDDLILTVLHDTYVDEEDVVRKIVSGLVLSKYSFPKMACKELGFGMELLTSFRMHRFRFFLLRAAYVVTRPYFKNKNIWLLTLGGILGSYIYCMLFFVTNIVFLEIDVYHYWLADIPFEIMLMSTIAFTMIYLYKPLRRKLSELWNKDNEVYIEDNGEII